jgi:hypothetical protein
MSGVKIMSITQTVYAYNAFGLNIWSEVHLPELPSGEFGEDSIDIWIKKGSLPETWVQREDRSRVVVDGDSVIFESQKNAFFCITKGREITVVPFEGVDERKIRLYLLGSCMGILLMQRKVMPLHGSAIEINGKAYAFVGHSGAGKSTLAAAFIQKGYKLLSDDVIPVRLSKERVPIAYPSYPHQKLWEESLVGFGINSSGYQSLFERETKYAVPVKESFYDKPIPLGGVFELAKGNTSKIRFKKIGTLEKFRVLLQHTYRDFLIDRLKLAEWHFKHSMEVGKRTPIFELRRPAEGFTAPRLVDEILKVIQEEEKE